MKDVLCHRNQNQSLKVKYGTNVTFQQQTLHALGKARHTAVWLRLRRLMLLSEHPTLTAATCTTVLAFARRVTADS